MKRELLHDHYLWLDEEELDGYKFLNVSGYGVFWLPEKETGFKLKVYEWVCTIGDEDCYEYDINSPNIQVEKIIDCEAIFEGIRHINIGDEGYFNYPDFKRLSDLFLFIRELENKYCRDITWKY